MDPRWLIFLPPSANAANDMEKKHKISHETMIVDFQMFTSGKVAIEMVLKAGVVHKPRRAEVTQKRLCPCGFRSKTREVLAKIAGPCERSTTGVQGFGLFAASQG
jgi:hypothetical protein